MKNQFDNSASDARAETAGGVLGPLARKPWKTPFVIKSELEDTEGGVSAGTDGGAGPATNS